MAIYYDVIYCSGCDNPNEDVKVYFHQGEVTTCITTSSTVTCERIIRYLLWAF